MSEDNRRAKQIIQSQMNTEAYEIQREVRERRQLANPDARVSAQAARFRHTKNTSELLLGAFDSRVTTAEEALAAPPLSGQQQQQKQQQAECKVSAMMTMFNRSKRLRIDDAKELSSSANGGRPVVPAIVLGHTLVSNITLKVSRMRCCAAFNIAVPEGTGYNGYTTLIKEWCDAKGQFDVNSRSPLAKDKRKYWVENFETQADVELAEVQDNSVDGLDISEILGET